MSVYVSAPVWKLRLPPSEKLVLLYLADCADEHGRNARPSQNRIAGQTGLSIATVCRSLKALLRAGLVEIEIPANVRKRWSNVYRVNLELILQKCHPIDNDSHRHERRLPFPRGEGPRHSDRRLPSPRIEGSPHSYTPSVLNPVKDTVRNPVRDSVHEEKQRKGTFDKRQNLNRSRKGRGNLPGGNPSDPRWQELVNEIMNTTQGKGVEISTNVEAWKVLGLTDPIGPLGFQKTWESRYLERANQGWTTGKIAFKFWHECRTYRIEMPNVFESALESAIRAEGITFGFHVAGGRATLAEMDRSILPESADGGDDSVESNDDESGEEEREGVSYEGS